MNSQIKFNCVEDGVRIALEAGAQWGQHSQCISRYLGGNLAGGVVYNDWTGFDGSVGMHVAGFDPAWINRNMLWVCFDYPFNVLQVKAIFGQVPLSNQRALDFDLKLGFKRVCVIEDVYPDGGMQLMRMYRHECRFLGTQPRKFLEEAADGR